MFTTTRAWVWYGPTRQEARGWISVDSGPRWGVLHLLQDNGPSHRHHVSLSPTTWLQGQWGRDPAPGAHRLFLAAGFSFCWERKEEPSAAVRLLSRPKLGSGEARTQRTAARVGGGGGTLGCLRKGRPSPGQPVKSAYHPDCLRSKGKIKMWKKTLVGKVMSWCFWNLCIWSKCNIQGEPPKRSSHQMEQFPKRLRILSSKLQLMSGVGWHLSWELWGYRGYKTRFPTPGVHSPGVGGEASVYTNHTGDCVEIDI